MEKKIDAEKQFISILEDEIDYFKGKKSQVQDKDRKAILSTKIADAQKAIEGHKSKLAKLQERETLRRSLRLQHQQTPRSNSKSPRTLPPTDGNGDLKRYFSPTNEGGDLKRRRSLSMENADGPAADDENTSD